MRQNGLRPQFSVNRISEERAKKPTVEKSDYFWEIFTF